MSVRQKNTSLCTNIRLPETGLSAKPESSVGTRNQF